MFCVKRTKTKTTYYRNGLIHRENGPAVIWKNGTKEWYLNNKQHREDGPAVEYKYGSKEWYLNDMKHREDGPAVIAVRKDGLFAHIYSSKMVSEIWYKHGKIHRDYGPAFISRNGTEVWVKNNCPWKEGRIIYWTSETVLAMISLPLTTYPLLWILEWCDPQIMYMSQLKLIRMIDRIRNQYNRRKNLILY